MGFYERGVCIYLSGYQCTFVCVCLSDILLGVKRDGLKATGGLFEGHILLRCKASNC